MTYFSVRKKATAIVLGVLFLIIAIACGSFSALGFGIKSVWRILMLLALITVIQISQKHLISGYEYILDAKDDILTRNRLTVIRVQGQKRFSLFTLSLKNLTAVIRQTKYKNIKKEYGKPSARMSFCPDISPSEAYILLFEVNGELTTITLQCDEKFAKELRLRAGV